MEESTRPEEYVSLHWHHSDSTTRKDAVSAWRGCPAAQTGVGLLVADRDFLVCCLGLQGRDFWLVLLEMGEQRSEP